MNIVIHTKTGCPYCDKAKEFLTQKGIKYDAILHDDLSDRQAMYDSFGLEGNKRTVPQIVIDGIRIGGYNELVSMSAFQNDDAEPGSDGCSEDGFCAINFSDDF
jgi:glutaredoxin